MFTVDSDSQLGRRRILNEEICEAASKNSCMLVAFASIDPHKGKMGAREAGHLIEQHGVKGLKFLTASAAQINGPLSIPKK